VSGIVVIGGSGLVGGLVLDRLAASGRRDVQAVLRRPVPVRDGLEQVIAPPSDWPERIARLEPQVLIVTLGTTIRQAGSQGAFRAVDHDLVLEAAAAARLADAVHCIAISAVGASVHSRTFYLRTKGEVEQGLRRLAFPRLDLLRPGLLLGARAGPPRPMERLGMALAPLTNALTPRRWSRYRAIEADAVARAIVALVGQHAPGAFVHDNDAMIALAR